MRPVYVAAAAVAVSVLLVVYLYDSRHTAKLEHAAAKLREHINSVEQQLNGNGGANLREQITALEKQLKKLDERLLKVDALEVKSAALEVKSSSLEREQYIMRKDQAIANAVGCPKALRGRREDRRISHILRDLGLAQDTYPPLYLSEKREQVVIDVGANDGNDYVQNGIGFGHKIIAFEPSEHSRKYGLMDRIKDVPHTLIDPVPGEAPAMIDLSTGTFPHVWLVGAAATESTRALNFSGAGPMGGVTENVKWTADDAAPMRLVAGVKIDDIIGPTQHVWLLKFDVQGHEFKALKGAEDLLSSGRVQYMFFEFWPYGMRNGGDDPVEFLHYIYDFGFECYGSMTRKRAQVDFRATTFAGYVGQLEERPPQAATRFIGDWDELLCWKRLDSHSGAEIPF